MSNEELMRPRYKVIADYPGNVQPIGHIHSVIGDMASTIYWCNEKDKYPHLFKKLEWWEDLTPEQVPKYIKSKDRKEVREVIELTPEGFKAKYPERPKGYRICYNNRWLPATAAEYEQYINQKEKQ